MINDIKEMRLGRPHLSGRNYCSTVTYQKDPERMDEETTLRFDLERNRKMIKDLHQRLKEETGRKRQNIEAQIRSLRANIRYMENLIK